MDIRKSTALVSIVLGAMMMIGGAGTWLLVSNTLGSQNITVSEDGCLGGAAVDGPFTAYCQARIIDHHAMESTGGKTYAELDREDPLRATAMNASFLQASLFTSVLAFGVSAMAAAVGLLFVLMGLGIREVEGQVVDLTESAVARS